MSKWEKSLDSLNNRFKEQAKKDAVEVERREEQRRREEEARKQYMKYQDHKKQEDMRLRKINKYSMEPL